MKKMNPKFILQNEIDKNQFKKNIISSILYIKAILKNVDHRSFFCFYIVRLIVIGIFHRSGMCGVFMLVLFMEINLCLCSCNNHRCKC